MDLAESAALRLALRRLRSTYPRALLKSSLRDLVARDVLRLRPSSDVHPGAGLLVLDGPAPTPPERVLQLVVQGVRDAPSEVRNGVVARELEDVVRVLVGRPRAGRRLVDAALADLADAGLVAPQPRSLLRPRRRGFERTPAGEGALQRMRLLRQPSVGTAAAATLTGGAVVTDASFDACVDTALMPPEFDSSLVDAILAAGSGSAGGWGGGGDVGGGGGCD